MSVPTAQIICDSISPNGDRLTTMEVKMHRFVLAEFNTHRVFSRNSSSSRAIPVKKMIERVKNDPAMPVFWGKNQSGMSADEEFSPEEIEIKKRDWLIVRDKSIEFVEKHSDLHKQLANRLLEPFMWHTAIVSSTDWTNAFAQRCHPAAQPETRAAFMAMQYAYYTSKPVRLEYGEWHLPYISGQDEKEVENKDYHGIVAIDQLKKISVARCARVSYLTHDGKRDIEEDIKMFDKLIKAVPMHASPLEHVATPHKRGYCGMGGNFYGWNQFRHFFIQENITEFIPNHPDLV
jgi:thymidylate synthase ThyX